MVFTFVAYSKINEVRRGSMQIAVKSDVGQRRSVNEDAAGYFYNQHHVPLVMVCDGIGGHNAGDVASAMALARIGKAWSEDASQEIEAIYQWLVKTIQEANDAIFQRSNQFEDLKGMGTTLVLATIIEGQLLIANVGDSRAYLMRQYQIKQLTEDQSLVNALVRSGEISPEEAKTHPSRHVVTQSLGVTLNVEIDFVRMPLKENDILLLCSDGLSDMLDADGIRDILVNYSTVEQQAEKMIQAANDAGGRDNITIAIAKINLSEEGSR